MICDVFIILSQDMPYGGILSWCGSQEMPYLDQNVCIEDENYDNKFVAQSLHLASNI